MFYSSSCEYTKEYSTSSFIRASFVRTPFIRTSYFGPKILIWLRHQPEATVGNTLTIVTLRELAAEKREATRKQSDIRSFFS